MESLHYLCFSSPQFHTGIHRASEGEKKIYYISEITVYLEGKLKLEV